MLFAVLISASFCWRAQEHKFIVKNALSILRYEKPDAYKFYNTKYWNKLVSGSWDPDIFEFKTGTHYYVYPGDNTINNGQYYKNGNRTSSSESARIRMEEHRQLALNYLTNGDMKNAFHEIGRACHYLGDISCTPHAAGIQYPLNIFATNYHAMYEKYAHIAENSGDKKYISTTAMGKYGIFDGAAFGYSINDLCRLAAIHKDKILSGDEAEFDKALTATMPIAQAYTACFLEYIYRIAKQ